MSVLTVISIVQLIPVRGHQTVFNGENSMLTTVEKSFKNNTFCKGNQNKTVSFRKAVVLRTTDSNQKYIAGVNPIKLFWFKLHHN